jgi:hypothetical protein
MALNPTFVESFARSTTENPLANNQWGRFQETGSNIASMQCFTSTPNSFGQATTTSVRNANIVTGTSFSANQWAELTVTGTPGAFSSAAVRLRGTSGNPGTAYDVAVSGTTWSIQVESGTTFTTLATGTTTALAKADVIRFEANGTTLTAYKNNVQVVTVTDATLNSGTVGIRVNPGTNIANIQFSQFRAGGFGTPTVSLGTWSLQSPVVGAVSADTPGQPNVLYETGAVILSPNVDGKIYKMLFGSANGMCYAESNDPITGWTRYSGNPVATVGSPGAGWNAYPRIFKNAGTYYAYIVNGNFLSMSSWTAPAMVGPWTQQVANAITPSQPSWNTGFTGQLSVLGQSGSTWYAYYCGYNGTVYALGLATSTDLLNWTADAGNPKITTEGPSNICFTKINNTYYGWSQIVQSGIPNFGSNGIPSDITRFTSTSLSGPWTNQSASTIYRVTPTMGIGTTTGQVADPSIIEVNGLSYMYATITPTGNGAPTNYQIAAFSSTQPLAQLVQIPEGVASIPQPSSSGFTNQLSTTATDTFSVGDPNFTTMTVAAGWGAPTFNSGNATGTTNATRGTAYWSASSWSANQWASIKVDTITTGTYVSAMVRGSTSGAATCYLITVGDGTLGGNCHLFLQKFVANVYTSLYEVNPFVLSANDIITISAIDNVISIYQNNNLLYSIVDTAIASGSPGFSLYPNATPSTAKITQFTAGTTVTTYSITGNAGVAGVAITWTGTTSGNTVTDSSGNYAILNLASSGTYTITPSKTGYTFNPVNSVQVVSGANLTGVNFTAIGSGGSGTADDMLNVTRWCTRLWG